MTPIGACPDEEFLAALALGEPDARVDGVVEQHLLDCLRCRALLEDTLATLALLSSTSARSSGARQRLEHSVGRLERFSQFVPAVGRVLDVDGATARRALHEFYDGQFAFPLPGVAFRKAPVGASKAGAFAVLARLEPGVSLPRHRHLGEETTIVLAGGLIEGAASYGPGELLRADEGTSHEVTAAAGEECCCVVVVQGGVSWG